MKTMLRIASHRVAENTAAIIHALRITAMALMAIALGSVASSCHNADIWDEVPGEIAKFVNNYFPSSELESFTHSGQTYHLRIDDGPGMTFDEDYNWIAVDGYGMPLPQVLLFDVLPPRLYEYIQEMEQLNGVFSISRDDKLYTAVLLDTTVSFNVATGELKGVIDDGKDETTT